MGLVNKLPGELIEGRDGEGRVQIGTQVINARLSEDLYGALGAVTVAIRPEAIRLGAREPATACNVLSGRLMESSFLGNIVDHQVDVGGALVRVQGDRQQT